MLGFIYEITNECNLKCPVCYKIINPVKSKNELDFNKACQVIDKVLSSTQAGWLEYSGGEPACCNFLLDIMNHVSYKFPKVKQGIVTNATMVDEDYLDKLVNVGLSYVEISLFAENSVCYKQLTGKDYYYRIAEAAADMKLYGLPLIVAIMLSKQTASSLESSIDIALATGADEIALNQFLPLKREDINLQDFELSRDELVGLLKAADTKAAEASRKFSVSLPLRPCQINPEKFPHLEFSKCICGKEKWVIDSQGNLRTCELNKTILGNLLKDDFATLSTVPAVEKFINFRPYKYCSDCDMDDECRGGCNFALY